MLKDVCAQIPRHARPSASIGIAVSPEHGSDATGLIHSASLALRNAKRAGGGTFRVFARDMAMAVEARLKMEKAISDGLHQAWFELNFQPQYDLRNRRLTGFEALVRMNHPELGEQLPDAFLPAAEASGLMQPLGEWIVRDALTAATRWPRHLALAINISTAQFRHGDIAGLILNALGKSELAPSRLRLEISEATLLDETSTVREQLRRLKARGITIVIDDFGMQLSRLRSLSRSTCDAVKLDRTLVESVGADRNADNLASRLIAAARSFDLDVSAEGIERAEQVQFLVSNACENVQGYLFGRPAPARELAAIIAKDVRKSAAEGEERAAQIPSSAAA